jgi:L-rhamnose mutarotase
MRVALHTRVASGREAEYDQAHREVPDELVRAIRAAGARSWSIWRSGQDLFHVVDCEDYARLLGALETLPVNVAWQQRINALLDVPHDYSEDGATRGLPVVWELPRA